MEIFSILGLYLVEASYLPQLWRLYRLKEADEFSFLFPGLNIAGRTCGVIFSITHHQSVLGWFFVVGIVLRATLLAQVCYYRLRTPARSSVRAAALSGS